MLCEIGIFAEGAKIQYCLNPCSNGRCSASVLYVAQLMGGRQVLILVLMEDALRVRHSLYSIPPNWSLNPCSNGRCSAREERWACLDRDGEVLILVLMEDALRDFFSISTKLDWESLNPCSNGRCSARDDISSQIRQL